MLWVVAFGVALALDPVVIDWVRAQKWDRRPYGLDPKHWLIEVMKAPGEYLLTLAVAGLLLAFYRRPHNPEGTTRWQAAGLVLGAGALAGLNGLLKWVAGRRRPVATTDHYGFDLFVGGINGLFGAEKNLSFPSGHAALAFAMASSLAVLLPRWTFLFYAIACVTAVERLAENAHHLSDSVAGAAVGCLATWTVVTAHRWWSRRQAMRTPQAFLAE